MQEKHVVIIGGGFAGINLARGLIGHDEVRVTLVDRNNYNYFQPLLYQVATGLLEVSSITLPFRTILKGADNVRFRLGSLKRVNVTDRAVQLSTGDLEYDLLVLATGTQTNYFGMDRVEKESLSMKTVEEALALRNHLLSRTEEATMAEDPEKRSRLLTIVVSGAGPTGVELAGMLAEMRRELLERVYPELHRGEVDLVLVDAAPTVLPPMRVESQRYTHEVLQEMGVRVLLNKSVKDYRDGAVVLADGQSIPAATFVWAAGVTGRRIEGLPESSYARGNRLIVDAFNRVESVPDVFAIGDAALQRTDERFPKGHPQLASVAMQQGRNMAGNILALSRGGALRPFRYVDKGTMAIIGRSKATADLNTPAVTVTGWTAWVMWLFVHLFQLISYRNRLSTMWDWTTAYFARDQSLGMIIGGCPKGEEHSAPPRSATERTSGSRKVTSE